MNSSIPLFSYDNFTNLMDSVHDSFNTSANDIVLPEAPSPWSKSSFSLDSPSKSLSSLSYFLELELLLPPMIVYSYLKLSML